MIDFLRSWVTNIAVVIVFITLLEILMPNGDMKRYTKVISGLIIILVIIKPFMMLKDIDKDFKLSVFETSAFIETNIDNKGNDLGKYNKSIAADMFRDNLKKQIVSHISSSCDVKKEELAVEVVIEADAASSGYGNLKEIVVTVAKGTDSSIQVSNISQVKISTDKKVMNENKPEYNLNDSKLSKDIKSSIKSYLGLNEEAITVKIQE